MSRKLDITSIFSAIDINDFDIHPGSRKAMCCINRGSNWELAILDLASGGLRKFKAADQSLMHPTYSPDGTRVAYHMDFEGDENHDVVVVGADGKGVKKITDGVEDNFEPEFSPDGKWMAFLSNRKNDIENLYLIGSDGGKIKKLTEEDLPIKNFSWSPCGDLIAYETGVGDDNYVSVVDPWKAKSRKALAKKRVEYGLVGDFGGAAPWHPDGGHMLFLSNENDALDVGEYDVRSRKTKWLVRSKNEKYCPSWSPDGKSLSYLEVLEPEVVLKVKSGKKTKIVSPPDGTTRIPKWLPDGGKIVFVNGSAARPDEVYVASLSKTKRITKFQTRPLPKDLLVQPRTLRYRSFDGIQIPALLYIPKDRSRRSGIVYPHGGPEMVDTNYWDQLTMMLLDKGFVVIKPNYRGSTGYGRKFLHLHDLDLGGGDYLDTIYAGKYLVESGLVDRDRLGYWGASYSGFTCMLSLTKHPEMWAAGVSIVGFFDWQTEHESERGYLKKYDESKMGDFSKNPEFFRERSPIHFLDKLRAPLLMTASSKDVRCPPTESRAVVAKLKKLGKKPEYHEYPDEGHWPRKRKNLIDLYKRSARFLDENIPK